MKSVVLFQWKRALCCFGFREEADKIRPVRICKHKAVLRYCAWCLFQQLHYCRQLSAPNWSSKQLPFKITKPVLFYLHTFCVVYRIHPTPIYYWIFLEGCLFWKLVCSTNKIESETLSLVLFGFSTTKNALLLLYCAKVQLFVGLLLCWKISAITGSWYQVLFTLHTAAGETVFSLSLDKSELLGHTWNTQSGLRESQHATMTFADLVYSHSLVMTPVWNSTDEPFVGRTTM